MPEHQFHLLEEIQAQSVCKCSQLEGTLTYAQQRSAAQTLDEQELQREGQPQAQKEAQAHNNLQHVIWLA